MVVRAWKGLFGGSNHTFVDLALTQVASALEAAELVRMTVAGTLDTGVARDRVRTAEHAGDQARSQLVEELAVAFTSPVDREDLYRFSRSIDDVLDNLRDLAQEIDLYRVADLSVLVPMVDAVIDAIEPLAKAVASLHAPSTASEAALAVKRGANRVRRRYQQSLAELFSEELTMDVLKRRELLRRLDVVGLRLGEAADCLADGAIKRSP